MPEVLHCYKGVQELEWYHRLMLCTAGKEIEEHGIFTRTSEVLEVAVSRDGR